jgi:hypothetical protein
MRITLFTSGLLEGDAEFLPEARLILRLRKRGTKFGPLRQTVKFRASFSF